MGVQADLVIESRLEEIARVRRWLSEHARAAGFAAKEAGNLSLVATEACTNVIRHAYGGEPHHPIELRLSIDETRVVLSIRDFGAKFDLRAYVPPDLDQPRAGGYGIAIIRSLMDEVEYDTSGEQGTTLTLVKYRSGPPS